MRTTEYSIEIDRPLDVVYDFSVDPSHMSEWLVDDKKQLFVDDGPLAPGSRYRIQQGEGGNNRRTFVYEVVALEPMAQVTVRTSGRLLTYTAHRRYVDNNGKSTVTEVIEMEDPPGLSKPLGGFMLGRIKKVRQQNLQRLKNIVEQQG